MDITPLPLQRDSEWSSAFQMNATRAQFHSHTESEDEQNADCHCGQTCSDLLPYNHEHCIGCTQRFTHGPGRKGFTVVGMSNKTPDSQELLQVGRFTLQKETFVKCSSLETVVYTAVLTWSFWRRGYVRLRNVDRKLRQSRLAPAPSGFRPDVGLSHQ